MSGNNHVKVTGLDELQRAFAAVDPITIRNKIVRPAITKACRRHAADVKSRVHKRSLARVVAVSVSTEGGTSRGRGRRATGGEVVGKVGPRRGKGGGAFILLNEGTAVRKTRKGYNRGRVRPHQWIQKSVRAQKNELERLIKSEVKEGFIRQYSRHTKKAI